jgi:uncharacterized protein YhfF
MRKTPLTDAMWAAYRGATGLQHDDYAVVAFGNGTGFETKLAELVLVGRKRATASLLRGFALDGEEPPVLGGHVVTVDREGNPRCIWRTTELRVGRLDSVDDAFAWDEGEGERTREWWLDAHRRLYAARAARDHFEFHDGMQTVFERFTVVWPPDVADSGKVTAG